jgi:hypothetical protein
VYWQTADTDQHIFKKLEVIYIIPFYVSTLRLKPNIGVLTNVLSEEMH